jgi:glycosyltransferase involved in cell wall biosynthesis
LSKGAIRCQAREPRRVCLVQQMTDPGTSPNSGDTCGPLVAILMAARNGERYLPEQLQSFIDQTHTNWSLHVSDDGSSDGTCEIVRRFSDGVQNSVTLRTGPQRGYSRNFMSLVCAPDITGRYFAFSDQDDIWNKDKLERALNWLLTVPEGVPAVYCSRTETVDAAGRHIGFSPLFTKLPRFRNAIVQNVGGGNTMVFNASARSLLAAVGDLDVVSHDWWAYQIVSAAGGSVRYDPQPSIKYRQHANNLIGSNNSVRARFARMGMLFSDRFVRWNDVNMRALLMLRSRLDPVNLDVLDQFILARKSRNPVARLWHLHKSGVYRQTLLGNLGLAVAAVLRKI